MSGPELLSDGEHDEEEALDEVEQYRMPLLEHLKELRSRVLRVAATLIITMSVSLYFGEDIINFLKEPAVRALEKAGKDGDLHILKVFEGVYSWLRAGFLGGALLGSPIIAWEMWGFIAPGLYKTEKRVVLPLTISSTVLFISGAFFAYYTIFPFAFEWLFTLLDVQPTLGLEDYLAATVKLMVAFGLCFQLPVACFFLARLGLLDHKDMLSYFRYAIVGIFVVAALVTPPDFITQSLLALPLIGLYGVGIVVAWAFTTKERVEEEAAAS